MKNIEGAVVDAGCTISEPTAYALTFYASSMASNNGDGIVVGSGTTAPTLDDYKLENQITSGISATIAKVIDGSGIRYVDISCNGSDSVTISEIGIVAFVFKGGGNGHSGTACLIERTTFNPITIQPGEVARIEYKITLNVPE